MWRGLISGAVCVAAQNAVQAEEGMPPDLQGGVSVGSMEEPQVPPEKENPLKKIVGLLEDMQRETKNEMETSEQVHEKIKCECDKTIMNATETIKGANSKIGELQASLKEYAGTLGRLKAEIPELEGSLADSQTALSEATAQRKTEREHFHEDKKMLVETIRGCKQGITVLKKQGSNLVEMHSTIDLVSDMKAKMTKFIRNRKTRNQKLADSETELMNTLSAQNVAQLMSLVEESQKAKVAGKEVVLLQTSLKKGVEEILGVLMQMLENAGKELEEREAEEKAARKSFEQYEKDKNSEIMITSEQLSVRQKERADSKDAQSMAFTDMEDTQAELDTNQVLLEDTQGMCKGKEAENKELKASQKDELGAIQEAIKILSDEVNAGEQKLFQKKRAQLLQKDVARPGLSALRRQQQAFLEQGATNGDFVKSVEAKKHRFAKKIMDQDLDDDYIAGILNKDAPKEEKGSSLAVNTNRVAKQMRAQVSSDKKSEESDEDLIKSGLKLLQRQKQQSKQQKIHSAIKKIAVRQECSAWIQKYDHKSKKFIKTCADQKSVATTFLQTQQTTNYSQMLEASEKLKELVMANSVNDKSAALLDLQQKLTSKQKESNEVFAVVVEGIEKMIVEVKEEQKQDDTEHATCIKDIDANKAEKLKTEDDLKSKLSQLEQLKAEEDTMAQEKLASQKEYSELHSEQKETASNRALANSEFVSESANQSSILNAVNRALNVLKMKLGEKGGKITALLEEVSRKTEKNIAVLKATEEVDVKTYEKFMAENQTAQDAVEESLAEHTVNESRMAASKEIMQKKVQHGMKAQEAITKALADVESNCAETLNGHTDRAAKRKDEIEGLQAVSHILNGAKMD